MLKITALVIALVYISYIKKQMSDQSLYKRDTLPELLDELDTIQSFEQSGNALRIGEITKKPEELHRSLVLNCQPRYNYSGSQDVFDFC